MKAGMKHYRKHNNFRDFLLILVKASPLGACLSLACGGTKRRRRVQAISLSLLMIVTLLVSSFSPLIPQQTAKATGSMADSFSLPDQVKSFMYYRTLGSCVTSDSSNLSDGGFFATGDWINQTNAKNGAWFAQGSTPGAYLNGIDGITLNNKEIDCSKLVNGALKLWGSWAPDQALCSMGFRRVDDGEFKAGRCTDAQNGTDQFMRDNVSKYAAAVKSRVYGGKEPSLSNEAKYLLYLKSFQLLCAPTAATSTSSPKGTTTRDYAVRQVSRVGTGTTATVPITTTYYVSRDNLQQSDKVSISPGADLSSIPLSPPELTTCGDLVKAINGDKNKNNGLADAYQSYLIKDKAALDTSVSGTACAKPGATVDSNGQPCPNGGSGTASTCAIDGGLSWILCPALITGANLADGAYKFLSNNFLATDPSLVNTDPAARTAPTKDNPDGALIGTGTFTAWKIIQGIGNVGFIIAVLLIIFSQLTSIGISNYGVKKLLPRVVLAAILVNLSFLICQVAVDVSNILGFSLKSLLEGVAKQVTDAGGGAPSPTGNDSGNLAGIAVIVLATAGVAGMNVGALIIAVVGAIVSLLTIFLLLVVRKVLIVLLIVVAPLAFVAFLLPNTEPLFQKWRKMLTSLLLLFPVIGVLYGASLLASAVLMQVAGADPVLRIAAYMALVIPLIAAIPLLKGSLDGIGKLGGALQSYGQKARSGAQGGAKAGINGYKNSGFGKFRTAYKADRKSRIAAGTFRGDNRNPLNWGRNVRARANTAINSNRPVNTVTGGFGAERDLAAQSQNRKDQQEAIAMFGNDNALVAAWAESSGETNHPAFKALNKSQQDQFQKMRGAGHHRKATSYLAAAQSMSENGTGSADLIQSALEQSQKRGASSTVADGARLAAIAAYRKSGRGDAVADLSSAVGPPMTQEEGWAQVSASTVHRDGIDAVNNPAGATSYNAYLNADQENTRKALAGYDGMEERAKNDAQVRIVTAARGHESAATGGPSTITSIQQAKVYFGIK